MFDSRKYLTPDYRRGMSWRRPVPRWTETEEGWRAYRHLDLMDLTDAALRREWIRWDDAVRDLIDREVKPHPWYAERGKEVKKEMAERGLPPFGGRAVRR